MQIWYEDDLEVDACILKMRDLRLLEQRHIEQWVRTMQQVSDAWLEQRGGERWFCLIDLTGFEINPSLLDQYGAHAKAFVDRYFTNAVRYGFPEGLCSASAIKIAAIGHSFQANLYRDRQAALAALPLAERRAS